ncbi:ATP-binding protein [Sorangium sp. So ce1389]
MARGGSAARRAAGSDNHDPAGLLHQLQVPAQGRRWPRAFHGDRRTERLRKDEHSRRAALPRADDAMAARNAHERCPEAFLSIQEAAKRVIPTLERIRTRRAKVQRQEYQSITVDGDEATQRAVDRFYWGQQLVLDFKGAPDVPAPLASEGTLLVIGLLTALWMDPRPRLLLLDDIDKALHPRAQEELVAQIRKILEMTPDLQVVATSHSPYLLDHFEAQDVLLTALLPDGSTACARLTDHPDFDRWKSTTRSGELWSFVGEDWVAQQAIASQGQG